MSPSNGRAAPPAGRVAVLVFPGTNSEEETVRACRAVGLDARSVGWNEALRDVRAHDAFVLPGGFAYEDRVRAGAVAAHDRLMTVVREGAAEGKAVLGICNGAQVLLESGLVPGIETTTRPEAGFARNAPLGRFRATQVFVKLVIEPRRCSITAALPPAAVIPAWAAHAEGRLAASDAVLDAIARDHLAFVYCDPTGAVAEEAVPNGSALGAAGLVNKAGNVLALMPHPERDAWTFNHQWEPKFAALARSGDSDGSRWSARGNAGAMLAPSGGIELFRSFAAGLGAKR